MKEGDINIDQFLNDYRRMSIAPSQMNCIQLKGKFDFIATIEDNQEIEDSYELEIFIPSNFPKSLPEVKETAGKITHENSNGHLFPNDILCLGSPMRQLIKIYENPTLVGFAENCLIPYLYAISYKMKNGGDLIFGELSHGKEGLIEDYMELLGLNNIFQFLEAIKLLVNVPNFVA